MYLQQAQQQHLHSWQVSCVDQVQQQTRHLASQQTAAVQHCRRQLLLSLRHFTSSSSCCAETPASDAFAEQETKQQQKRKQQEEDLQSVLEGMPGELLRQPIFTNKLSSNIKSRKPAIKTPARHQWRHTAEDYDPMEPFAAQNLPPYAPLLAHTKDYNQIYKETQPKFNRGRCAGGLRFEMGWKLLLKVDQCIIDGWQSALLLDCTNTAVDILLMLAWHCSLAFLLVPNGLGARTCTEHQMYYLLGCFNCSEAGAWVHNHL